MMDQSFDEQRASVAARQSALLDRAQKPRIVYIVRCGDLYAAIVFDTTIYRESAKPYRSLWRARFRAWRLNRQHLFLSDLTRRWHVEEMQL